jgi:integrase
LDTRDVFAVVRTVRNPKLDSRTAREKLPVSGKPRFLSIGKNLHLGYRKGKSGGVWVMRRYVSDRKNPYVVGTIGTADDRADADGVEVLTFHQAVDKARKRAGDLAEKERIAALGPVVTVEEAIREYVATRTERESSLGGGGKGMRRDARSRLTKHLLQADPGLASKPLATLTSGDLARWRERKGETMAPASVQRLVNDLRAALNLAVRRYKGQLPPAIRDEVRDGLASVQATAPVARAAQIISDADVRRLISAASEIDAEQNWDGDLGRIVLVLASTGARFSQVARLRVGDLQTGQERLMVPTSRKGAGQKQTTHIPVPLGPDVVRVLAQAAAGRRGSDVLLLRPRWRRVAGPGLGRLEKLDERMPWYSASELTRPWNATVKRAGLSPGIIPYALRHSSIVRGLSAGLPTRLVAALHDTSSEMIESHYAAFITDALGELARRAVIPLAPAPVTSLSAARR